MSTEPHYFAIIGTSSAGYGGVRWSITAYNSKDDIIGYASEECNRAGSSLEDVAGIKWIGVNPDEDGGFESFEPEREFAEGELFQAALTKLNDDCRTYKIFADSNQQEIDDFLMEAEAAGHGEKAAELVEKFSHV
jgi:hypothetical protein